MAYKTKKQRQEAEQRRVEAIQNAEAQMPEAIAKEMGGVFKRLDLPPSPVIFGKDDRITGGIRISLGEAEPGRNSPNFGNREFRQAKVMAALAISAQIAGMKGGIMWDYTDGSLVFTNITDLAVAVKTAAAAHPAQADGKYQNLIKAGPKAGYEVPKR